MSYINVVGVQFNKAGKIYDFFTNNISLRIGDSVVVDTDRGSSLAKVVKVKYVADSEYEKNALKKVIRKASHKDLDTTGKLTEEDAIKFTRDKVKNLDLDMRILKGEIQFSGNKVIIYFTSPGRVDFRDLVKELASGLKTRVELKQVGARDEAKLIGGLGICGREFCCSSFLREFVPVSIKMAKNQNLALNPTKISGGCGRLLCCLTYENDTYTNLRAKLPALNSYVEVHERSGLAKVVRTDFFNQIVLVSFDGAEAEEFPAHKTHEVSKEEAKRWLEGDNKESEENLETADASWGEDIDLEALQDEPAQEQKPQQNKSTNERSEKKGDRKGPPKNNRGRNRNRNRKKKSPRPD